MSSTRHPRFMRGREDRHVRVLIVEDELRMASLIHRGLVHEGLAADVAGNGDDALWMAQAHDYDAVVLDVMLPEVDGFEVCRRLRGAGVWAPVLMLTLPVPVPLPDELFTVSVPPSTIVQPL